MDITVKLCGPCWSEGGGLAVEAVFFPLDVPMCERHYSLLCQSCRRQWGTKLGMGEYQWVCDECDKRLKRLEARRDEYSQHLGSNQWLRMKKTLRKESRRENCKVVCIRCGLSEQENKETDGHGLHGHTT